MKTNPFEPEATASDEPERLPEDPRRERPGDRGEAALATSLQRLGESGAKTQHHPADESLRLLNSAVQAAANGVVITDTNGTIQWVNAAFTSTGCSPPCKPPSTTPGLLRKPIASRRRRPRRDRRPTTMQKRRRPAGGTRKGASPPRAGWSLWRTRDRCIHPASIRRSTPARRFAPCRECRKSVTLR